MTKTKQQPLKRKYVKKAILKPVKPVDEEFDTELKTLALICSVLDNWTPEQKGRNLRFINSKYSEYL